MRRFKLVCTHCPCRWIIEGWEFAQSIKTMHHRATNGDYVAIYFA